MTVAGHSVINKRCPRVHGDIDIHVYAADLRTRRQGPGAASVRHNRSRRVVNWTYTRRTLHVLLLRHGRKYDVYKRLNTNT